MESKIYKLYCEKKIIENQLNYIEMKIDQEKIKGNRKCDETKRDNNPVRFIVDIVKDVSAGAALFYIACYYILSRHNQFFYLVALVVMVLGVAIILFCICTPVISSMVSKSKSKKIKLWEYICLIFLAIFCIFVMLSVFSYTFEKAGKDINKNNTPSFIQCGSERK